MSLSYLRQGAPDAPRLAFILHGILGSARNWRLWARRLASAHPTWQFVVPDLRHHGESHEQLGANTVRACARDLAALATELGQSPDLVIGHSFGGKVAMAYGREMPAGLRGVWVLDAIPSAPGQLPPDHEVARVIRALQTFQEPFDRRESVRDALVGMGFSDMLAGWMTTNLRRSEAGFVWRFDLDAVLELLEDYMVDDLWPWLQQTAVPVHLVRAGASDRWDAHELARLQALPAPFEYIEMPDAGHWLHVDDPDTLFGHLSRGLHAVT